MANGWGIPLTLHSHRLFQNIIVVQSMVLRHNDEMSNNVYNVLNLKKKVVLDDNKK